MTFQEWLAEKLADKDWSQNYLGEQAGLSKSEVSRIMNGKQPSLIACKAIASALSLPADVVLREAGHISKPPNYDSEAQELLAKILQLNDNNKKEVNKLLDLKIEIQEESDHGKKKRKS